MKSVTPKGQKTLIEEVLDQSICVRCGACVGLCPYFGYHDGQVVVLDGCEAETWRCLQICPRADYEATSLERRHEGSFEDGAIGPCREIRAARANDGKTRTSGQYGGMVSALLMSALEKGHIKSAVVTDSGNGLSPSGRLIRSSQEILECAGSRYSASGCLAALNAAIRAGEDHICVVGLPCQMEALEKMARSVPHGQERVGRVTLSIGLFCTWALDYRKLRAFIRSKDINGPVQKYDIPPPPAEVFRVRTRDGWSDFPLGEIRPLVQKGCGLCSDMTAEWADVSVGTLEGEDDWNTVVIRTERGARIFHEAVNAGFVETRELPGKNLDHLEEAASNKRARAEAARQKGDRERGHDE
jgi:coenzyme F420 hydrogenase subunit beta